MKRILALIIIVFISLPTSGCENKISSGNYKGDALLGEKSDKEKERGETLTGQSQNTTFVKEIKPLESLDFAVTDGKNNIILDSPYRVFKSDRLELKLENNYVGETYSGEFIYKTYMHKFTDFNLYVSNTYYNLKNRNFDDYYITQITVKSSNFKTLRGITIGSKEEDLINAYGSGAQSTIDGKKVLIYVANDMEISFAIGENQRVEGISLRIA